MDLTGTGTSPAELLCSVSSMTSAAVKVRGARVVALRATGLQVDGDVLCEVDDGQPFTAMGEVRLRRAHVYANGFGGAGRRRGAGDD